MPPILLGHRAKQAKSLRCRKRNPWAGNDSFCDRRRQHDPIHPDRRGASRGDADRQFASAGPSDDSDSWRRAGAYRLYRSSSWTGWRDADQLSGSERSWDRRAVRRCYGRRRFERVREPQRHAVVDAVWSRIRGGPAIDRTAWLNRVSPFNQSGSLYASSSAGNPAPPTATTMYCLPFTM
jgi:hypothetical protein